MREADAAPTAGTSVGDRHLQYAHLHGRARVLPQLDERSTTAAVSVVDHPLRWRNSLTLCRHATRGRRYGWLDVRSRLTR